MKVQQIYEIINASTKSFLGESAVLTEDLSNIVDIGTELFNANAVENYTKTLVDHIGKVVFTNKNYKGYAPSVLMDAWEYGSVLEKIQMDMPKATSNDSWNLVDGQTYEENTFYKPVVSVKFYNSKTTFEIPISITDKQVKSAFSSATQMNSFLSMIFTAVENAMTLAMDELVMKTIANFMALTIFNDYEDEGITDYTTASGVRAVNLLYLYNKEKGQTLTKDKALYDAEFIRYASYKIKLYVDRMSKISTLFNIGKKQRFTPLDEMHIVLLSEFKSSADVYLESDTFHNELVKLPNSESVPYWQGSGEDYGFNSTSKIHVKTPNLDTVECDGILGCIFDRQALGVANFDRRTPSKRVAPAEFTNYWFKQDAQYFNDANENFVLFFIA